MFSMINTVNFLFPKPACWKGSWFVEDSFSLVIAEIIIFFSLLAVYSLVFYLNFRICLSPTIEHPMYLGECFVATMLILKLLLVA
jgi:hypothetical protein